MGQRHEWGKPLVHSQPRQVGPSQRIQVTKGRHFERYILFFGTYNVNQACLGLLSARVKGVCQQDWLEDFRYSRLFRQVLLWSPVWSQRLSCFSQYFLSSGQPQICILLRRDSTFDIPASPSQVPGLQVSTITSRFLCSSGSTCTLLTLLPQFPSTEVTGMCHHAWPKGPKGLFS